jgi:metal-responsive CopG/Arc/MetJ family transcriptional regulator
MTMTSIKTAVSLQKSLLDRAERMARSLKVSRSHLVALALEDYLERQHSRKILEQINAAHANEPDPEERRLMRMTRKTHRRIVGGEW